MFSKKNSNIVFATKRALPPPLTNQRHNKEYRESLTGFTLVELVIYTAIFASVAGLMTSILVTSTKITTQQVVTTQVSNELNLVLDTVQRLVRDSSLIECVSNSNCTLTTGSYLKLRFQDQTLDPTCVYLSGTQILVARGPDATNSQNCTATTQALTTDKVNVDSLTFTKFDVPGGHATVQIDATLTYNSTNPDLQLSRTLRSAIGRVSAATFDSDLLPDATNSRNIGTLTGTPRAWRNVFLSGVLGLGSYTDAQESGITTTTGGVYYNTTGNNLKVYNGTSWQAVGGSLTPWTSNINAAGFTLSGNSTASSTLTLDSTSHATKGNILLNPTGGNVGIGVASPAAKLDVAGGVKLANDAATCDSTKAGTIRWSGTKFEACTGTAWTSFVADYGVATGGIGAATDITVGGVAYKLLQFNSTGTLTVTTPGLFDVLLVGGGGAGADSAMYNIGSGGGGGGGILQTTVYLPVNASITVGVGGLAQGGGSNGGFSLGGSGGFSSIVSGETSVSAMGGGGGRSAGSEQATQYSIGGNNGGGGIAKSAGMFGGYDGGQNGTLQNGNSAAAGGGGGAGGAGTSSQNTSIAGAGGPGKDISTFLGQSATTTYKSGGGGGGAGSEFTNGTAGAGGIGGGGNGGNKPSGGTAGIANSGSGGGGAGSYVSRVGYDGGSGIVYIRFKP